MTVRAVNVVLGAWLFISAFLWPHTPAQFINTWILGLLFIAFALIAMRYPMARYINTALSVWLFISAFALYNGSAGTESGTTWNNALLAIAICMLSLAPTERVTTGKPFKHAQV